MDETERQGILGRADRLKCMTEPNGCTPDERNAAALKLGRLVQDHDLTLAFPHSLQKAPPPPPDDSFCYGIVTVGHQTEKAILCVPPVGANFWIPKSQLRGACTGWQTGDHGHLYCSFWWAQKERWT